MGLGSNKATKTGNGHTNGKFTWRSNEQAEAQNAWGAVDPAMLRLAIDTITRAGGAIILGITADGGAFSVCVLMDTDKVKEYPHSLAELEGLLQSLTDHFLNL